MKCPHCQKEIFTSTDSILATHEQRIKQTLRYMLRVGQPMFGGLIKRGVIQQDAEIVYMLANDLIEAVDDTGFKVTAKGIEFANS